jgi:glutamate racemase
MIGIFDSGSGGLTMLAPIRRLLPDADILYFGDIKNAPYGNRTHEELTQLTVDAIRFLESRGATSIVSACNSVSASLSLSLFDMLDLAPASLIEMVGPTAASFRDSDARILLCATAATIRSGLYQNAFRMLGQHIQTLPLPELAGAIEAGASEEEIERIVKEGLTALDTGSFDTVVLSCTHYPLVKDVFVRALPGGARIVDPGEIVAERVVREWKDSERGSGSLTFTVSQDSAPFRASVERLFPGTTYTVEVAEAQ